MNLQPFLKLSRRSDLPLKASSSSNDTNCIEFYGLSCLEQALKCKVCGKESKVTNMIDHVESNHLEGMQVL